MSRPSIVGSDCWRAVDVTADRSWEIVLTLDQRRALIDGARRARSAGCTALTVERSDLPLPTMQRAIQAWSATIAAGRGFVLLRQFPIDELTAEETELAYVGLGCHLGAPVGQNRQGDRLTHIRDEHVDPSAGRVRRYRTAERQDFHTDAADIVGLLCLQRSASGGESKIVSSAAVYNEMLYRAPELVDALYETVAWDRQGDIPDGAAPWFPLAPLSDLEGRPRLFYVGWYIRDSQMHADAPRLTERQLEAMALLESIANDPTYNVQMDFQPGDVQLLNNGRLLHAREAFVDGPGQERHLLRLWLAAHRFASVEAGLRGGIANPPTQRI